MAGTALLGALGLDLGLTSGGTTLAAPTPVVANLASAHGIRGEVDVVPGKLGWIFMSVDHAGTTGLVTCRLATLHGGTVTVGSFLAGLGHRLVGLRAAGPGGPGAHGMGRHRERRRPRQRRAEPLIPGLTAPGT